MTERERAFAALGFHHAEGIDLAHRVEIPLTGRHAFKRPDGRWDCQPYGDHTWKTYDDLLDAAREATPRVEIFDEQHEEIADSFDGLTAQALSKLERRPTPATPEIVVTKIRQPYPGLTIATVKVVRPAKETDQ